MNRHLLSVYDRTKSFVNENLRYLIGGGVAISGYAEFLYQVPKMASNIPAEANIACVCGVVGMAAFAVGNVVILSTARYQQTERLLEQQSERSRRELERTLESIEDSGRRAREEIRSYSR